MSDDIYKIVELVIRLAVVVIVSLIVPSVKKWLKNKQVDNAVTKAVYAVQQLCWKDTGKERKSYAMELAKGLLNKVGIKITDAQLSALIEAAVQELHVARGDYKITEDSDVKTD